MAKHTKRTVDTLEPGWAERIGRELAADQTKLPFSPLDPRSSHVARPPSPRRETGYERRQGVQRAWAEPGATQNEKGKECASRGGKAYARNRALDRALGKVE